MPNLRSRTSPDGGSDGSIEAGPLVVLVEDDPVMGESIVQWLSVEGYRSCWYRTGTEAIAGLAALRPDAIVCDIRLPDVTGEELWTRIAARLGGTPVVFVTGHGDVNQAVRLMKAGAADYLLKPFAIEGLLGRLEEMISSGWAKTDGAVFGRSTAMGRVERMLARVARVDSNVLISGESGTGKELAACYLHVSSPRASSPFVPLNCAAIPAELMESQLFGHERGAFTGAVQQHLGHAERAAEGTLFLDEVSELAAPLQAKLLRLLQDRTFTRIGGERPHAFRARIVAATNADLQGRVRSGAFREDLYYRLHVIHVQLPPLRSRGDDVLHLARRFLGEFSGAFGVPLKGFTTLAEEELRSYPWPGNIRELRNRVERAVVLVDGEWVGPADLFPERAAEGITGADPIEPLARVREAAERRQIAAALAATKGDVAVAAALLQVSRSTLFEKIRRLGIRDAA
jgi:DNA-binding NtrC family response regulator